MSFQWDTFFTYGSIVFVLFLFYSFSMTKQDNDSKAEQKLQYRFKTLPSGFYDYNCIKADVGFQICSRLHACNLTWKQTRRIGIDMLMLHPSLVTKYKSSGEPLENFPRRLGKIVCKFKLPGCIVQPLLCKVWQKNFILVFYVFVTISFLFF